MDPHRQLHHHPHHQTRHHLPQLLEPPPLPLPSSSSSPRYLPFRPPAPPPPPSFPDDRPNFFPPQRNLPPPSPIHHHNFSPRPPPCLLHHRHPPTPPPSHLFVNSPPHHHKHHRILDDDHREVFRSPPRVIPPNRVLVCDNHNPDDVDRHSRFRLPEFIKPPPPLLPPPSSRVPPLSPIARRSPPQFVQFDRFRREIDSPPRSREVLNMEPHVRLHRESIKYQLRHDRIDDRRILGVFDRLEGDFDHNNGQNRDSDRHEKYHPEMVLRKDFEINAGDNECIRRPLNDEVVVRGGRDGVELEENLSVRRGGGGGSGSREVSRSPIKFRIGGKEVDDGSHNRGRKEEVQEYRNRGTPRKNLQKKSALLRIQPGKSQQQHSSSSSFRNRFDNNRTPSPHKGKESNSGFLDPKISEERVGSPVELDVSFKSNALVAKAIMAAPSYSGITANVNNMLSDSNTRVDVESPSKVVSLKNSQSVSKREEKNFKRRVRVSPAMKRVRDPNDVEVHVSHLESSPGGSSGLSGGITCKASLKGEVLVKDDKNTGFGNVSTPNVRKKRKAISPLSRLSSPLPTKTDSGLVGMGSSPNHPCHGSIPSDISRMQSGKEVPIDGNVVGSTQNELMDVSEIVVNESPAVVDQEAVDIFVSEASAPKRMRRKGLLESLPDSPGLGLGVFEGHGNTKGYLHDEQRISDPDEDVNNIMVKCSPDTHTENNSVKGEDMTPVLLNNGSVEESSESTVVYLGNNVDNNDNCGGNVDNLNSAAVTSSSLIPVNILPKRENDVDLLRPLVDADKPCKTQVFSSPENDTIGLSLGGLYMDKYCGPELRHSEIYVNIGSVPIDASNDKRTLLSYDDDLTVGPKTINSVSDIMVTNDIQKQQYLVSDTTSVNNEATLGREESPKTCIYGGGALAFPAEEDSSLLNKKRKVGADLDSLDSRISVSCLESAVSLSFPFENTMLTTGKHSSAVSRSPCVELDTLQGNEFTGSCVQGVNTMSHISNLDPIEYLPTCSKKRKILPLESGFSDALGSECSDFPASANTLKRAANESSDKHSLQFVEGFELLETVITSKDPVSGATSSICAETCSLSDNTNSDFLCKDACISITESAPTNACIYSCLPESGSNQKVDGTLMMVGANDENGFIALESTCGMTRNDRIGGLQCLLTSDTGNTEQAPLSMNTKFDNNSALSGNPSSLTDCPQSCAESTCGRVINISDMLDTQPSAGLPLAHSLFSPTLNVSNPGPATHAISGEKLSMDGKKASQPFVTQNSLTSKVALLSDSHKNNLKPGIPASLGVQPFPQKSVSLPSKHAKATMSSLNSMSRQRRNVLIRSEASPSTSQRSSVNNPSSKAQIYQTKPRTWHRGNNLVAANIPVTKPSVETLPHRPLHGKVVKVQDTSYVRKGNSLVRNPASGAATSGSHASGAATSGSRASGAATSGSHASGASTDRSKPNDRDMIRKMVGSVMIESAELPGGTVAGGRSAPIEMPKTPPLPCSSKTSEKDAYTEACTPSLLADQPEGMDNEEALISSDVPLNSYKDCESVVNRSLEDPGMFSDGELLGSTSKRMTYIKRKSNQLVAASKTSQSSVSNMDKTAASFSDTNYYKRRKNQLIRASSEGNIQQMVAVIEDSSKSLSQRAPHVYSGRSSAKRLSFKVKSPNFSLVWKLGDSKSCGKGVDTLRSGWLLSHLLPWKRATYWSRKPLSSRKRGAVYVRSGRGFSLRRSKVISLPGTSLKWSKSMEKRSKKIEEEAALAFAAMDVVKKSGSSGVSSKANTSNRTLRKPGHGLKLHPGERIFRVGVFRYRMDPSRRTLQRISDEEVSDFTALKTEKDARKTYVPKRLLIGSDEYVRIGNGNQLVRDPKRRARILASEKVRWSLHTARMRLAKKRKFCQFFTRFGKCNKGEGKCPFIHDASKIAVCTKFLNGLCADLNCKLTHKVIPERMPDCSFFLQGLCSNENCPYRHVNVNPKASVCESFLRGYCAEGNECRKKHSYICPEFEASGSCPRGSKCKLYHPKKGKAKKRKGLKDQKNAKGRYFGYDLSVVDPETRPMFEKHAEANKGVFVLQGETGDFIGLDVSDDEVKENDLTNDRTFASEVNPLNSQLDDLDELIRSLRILGRL